MTLSISGPRELTGAVDLISQYKLQPHHDFFCKRPLPLAISDTHYLHNVVGDTEIRKGEGMELDQLVQNAYLRDKPASIKPFDMETLGQAFQLRETAPVDLPSVRSFLPSHFCFMVLLHFPIIYLKIKPINRLKKVYLLFRANRKVSPRTKRKNIKSTKTKIKTGSIRSTNIDIRIGLKTKTRTRIGKRISIMRRSLHFLYV